MGSKVNARRNHGEQNGEAEIEENGTDDFDRYYSATLAAAATIFEDAAAVAKRYNIGDERAVFEADPTAKRLRWFLLSIEAQEMLSPSASKTVVSHHHAPFSPLSFPSEDVNDGPTEKDEEFRSIWDSYRFGSGHGLGGLSGNVQLKEAPELPASDMLDSSAGPWDSNGKLSSELGPVSGPPRLVTENGCRSDGTPSNITSDGFPGSQRDEHGDRVEVDDFEISTIATSPVLDKESATKPEHTKSFGKDDQMSACGVACSAIKFTKSKKKHNQAALKGGDNRVCEAELDKKPARECWAAGHQVLSHNKADAPGTFNRHLRYKWHPPPSQGIFKPMVRAIDQFGMFRNGDRVLVCLSGGKDSLSLLHALRQYQFVARGQGVEFELGAVTVDPGSQAYNPAPLIDYLDGLNTTYLYEKQRIFDQAMSAAECRSICAFCSRMKRGRLYAAARAEGYNVLAFGQHLDDLAESFMMSLFYNASLRTMKAAYTVKEGDLRVVRPLVFVRERALRAFAEAPGVALPVIPENCPACFEAPKQRHRMKQLLAAQELAFPQLFANLSSALEPLMAVTVTDTSAMRAEALANVLKASSKNMTGGVFGVEDEDCGGGEGGMGGFDE